MSYFLEIEPTDDVNSLFSTFCKTYGNLLLLTTDEEKRINKLMYNKAEKALDRYISEMNL